jgi:hypothetical protein
MSYIRLDDFEKSLIEEISTLSSNSPIAVRDILEATFLRQLESLLEGKEIIIPFLGKILVKYLEDEWIAGAKSAKIDVFFSPSDLLKRFVGEIHDGDSQTLNTLIQKKIKGVLQEILNK